jgi:hypothetical protein
VRSACPDLGHLALRQQRSGKRGTIAPLTCFSEENAMTTLRATRLHGTDLQPARTTPETAVA